MIDSPAALARSSLPCVGGPFRCYRNKNLTKRAQLLTNAGFTLQTTTPGGTCADCPHRPSPLRCRAKVRTAARSHRGRCASAVRRQDVPGHGHHADHSYRQPHLCAGLPRQSSRDSRCRRPPRPTTAKSAYARPVAEGRRRRRAHRSTRLRRVPRRARPRHRRPQHGGGHTTWTDRTCDQTVYGPPLNIHCTCLGEPATVRISTRRS